MLAEVAWTGKVLCVRGVVGPEEMIPVVGVAAAAGVAEAAAAGLGKQDDAQYYQSSSELRKIGPSLQTRFIPD